MIALVREWIPTSPRGAWPPVDEFGRAQPAETHDHAADLAWAEVDTRVQYGGHVLEAACEFLAQRRGGAGSWRSLGAHWLRGPIALLLLLTSLPRLRVRLTPAPTGLTIARHLRARKWGIPKNRIAQGVLPVPACEAEYLRQGSRLMRRQARRARDTGITCDLLAATRQRLEVVEYLTPLLSEPETWVQKLPDRAEDQWWVARDSDGRPVALAIVVVDQECAMLELLRSTEHPARYLLHLRIVQMLAQAGVRYMLTDSPTVSRMEPNLRRFQRILGYRIANLSLTRM